MTVMSSYSWQLFSISQLQRSNVEHLICQNTWPAISRARCNSPQSLSASSPGADHDKTTRPSLCDVCSTRRSVILIGGHSSIDWFELEWNLGWSTWTLPVIDLAITDGSVSVNNYNFFNAFWDISYKIFK